MSEHKVREKCGEIDNMDWNEDLSWEHKMMFDTIVLKVLQSAIPTCDKYLKASKKIAREIGKKKGIIHYTNPLSGFPVAFSARKMESRRVEVQTPGGSVIRLNLKKPATDNTVDVRKITTAMAPNLTHSIDSALLFQVSKHVTGDICFIHDSCSTNINNLQEVVKGYAAAMTLVATTDPFNDIFEQLGTATRLKMKGTATLEDIKSIQHSRHILA